MDAGDLAGRRLPSPLLRFPVPCEEEKEVRHLVSPVLTQRGARVASLSISQSMKFPCSGDHSQTGAGFWTRKDVQSLSVTAGAQFHASFLLGKSSLNKGTASRCILPSSTPANSQFIKIIQTGSSHDCSAFQNTASGPNSQGWSWGRWPPA